MNTNNHSDHDKDLEYELPEEQFGEEEEMGDMGPEFQEEGLPPGHEPPTGGGGFWKKLPKKKILVGIGVVVMIALIYQFLTRQEEKAAAYSRSGAFNGYAVTKRSLAVSFNQTM